MLYQRSSALFKDAQEYIPGGVNSPVRAFKSVGGTPIFIKKAEGAYIYDEDGRAYVDYINSWGPMIVGHTHPEVLSATVEQMKNGFSFGTPTELETEIAKLITSVVPNIDMVRMVNSGTEACMSAIRLARGYTNRDKIVKFEGCYHGHSDSFLIKAGSGAATFGNPNSPGVTQGTAKDTLLAEYNNLDEVKALFENNKDQIAAIIVEPIAGNMGCILPEKGFLEGLRQICDENGALLIFDEVMTGFRQAMGGSQERLNIKADIVTFGKVIGGGFPVGAFAARREIMNHLAPLGPVYQAGTLSGNPIAMRAGITTLNIINNDRELFTRIDKATETLDVEISKILAEKGIANKINRLGSMMSLFFTKQDEINNFTAVTKCNHDSFNKFFHHLLANGVYLAPSGYETWFISDAIKDTEINKTLDAVRSFEI
ncbi:glutamate-1-semialdehyde 2,1-aminomutase [Algoriella xinjiangensis]|uniref:Glutamate-1-semialdehyde 2,1-aminomutase n=1 Tax=Algoriella xinjiangensis TaxID=684065 RepID=A0A1I4W007_9FLAO|nr:glutamate-1-semialdehyde 2,1-aminomutase [Algoriella xinjiangensis]SFN06783.1 glutamate-1-semialdehyde 2,1-aminomutase [Algoriella xinjiangensis]VDH15780.1 Glutamate-1-semialdehyde 2,1-aminomutase [Algoriella xinjiangensis]